MIPVDFFWLIPIWVTTLVIGIISWPSSALLFGKLSDKGYSISKIFGLIVIAYLFFVLATIKLLPLSLLGLILVMFIWASFNFFLEHKYKIILKDRKLPGWKKLINIEIAFFALLVFWAFVRAHQPQILGIERFPDFAFISAFFNANHLPVFDPWYLGGTINYYYFGQFMAYILLQISRIPPVTGFFVLVAWMFGLLGINVYRFGRDALSLLIKKRGMSAKKQKGAFAVAGIISFFSVLLAGTWHTLIWLLSYIRSLLSEAPPPPFWYPGATRTIPGTITDMPVYGFFESDLHAHMWGLFNGILILTLLYLFWQNKKYGLNLKNPYFWLLGFVLGISYMTNSWDAMLLGILSVIVVLFKFYAKPKLQLLKIIVFMAVFAYLISLPWSYFFDPPIGGIGLVEQTSPLRPWIMFWGAFLSLIIIFLIRIYRTSEQPQIFHLAILCGVIFFIIFMEIFYIKDLFAEGEFYRVNTVFKVTHQIWLWLGALAGSMIVWIVLSAKTRKTLIFFTIILSLLIAGQAIYPVKIIKHAALDKELTGLDSGLNWWKQKSPHDYEAYLFLEKIRQSLPRQEKIKNIVEAEGESFSDFARFSVFLGWPTIIGWPGHQWTWRGTHEVTTLRLEDIRKIYTSQDKALTKSILEKYEIDYIIVGQLERERYGDDLNLDKLISLGETIFQNKETLIIGL